MVSSLMQIRLFYYRRKGFFLNAEKLLLLMQEGLLPLIQERLSWQSFSWERLTFVRFGWRRLTFLVQERLTILAFILEMLPILITGIFPF